MIPDYQTLMLPVLKSCSLSYRITKDVIAQLAMEFDLSEEEQRQLLPSGKMATFSNRVNWAKSYLKQAGLIAYIARGQFEITETGRQILQGDPDRIDNNFLKQFDSFKEFLRRRKNPSNHVGEILDDEDKLAGQEATPDEILRSAYRNIRIALAADLLDRVRQATPAFFEGLIVELLIAMGYGGSTGNVGRAIGKSGDGGIDGVIDQDPLGVDQIYIQAKRYGEGNNIGPSALREFYGALNLRNAQKGIFFTTSAFSSQAEKTADDLGMRIVLIDGQKLADLMIQYNVGCQDEELLHLKKINEDYFE